MIYSDIREREQQHIKELLKDDEKYAKNIDNLYRNALTNIQGEILSELDFLSNLESVSMSKAHQVISVTDVEAYHEKAKEIVEQAQDRMKKGEKVSYIDYSSKINQELKRYNVTARINRLQLLEARINLATAELADKEFHLLASDIDRQLLTELERQAGILSISVPSMKRLRQLIKASQMADVSGVEFSDRIWANQNELTDNINNAVRRTLIRGEHPTKAAQSLKSFVKQSMIGDKNKAGANYYAKRLAVTESARAQIIAQQISFKEAEIDKYEWIAETDSKTCPECRRLDGKIFDVKDLKPFDNAPPLHPWCRCSVAAYVGGEHSIMFELPELAEIKTDEDVKMFTEKVIKNWGLEKVKIEVKPIECHGYCIISNHTTAENIHYNNLVLNSEPNRSMEHRIKTAFHEMFHLSANGKEWDGLNEYRDIIESWLDMEETMTECASHYLAEEYGIQKKLAPSYSEKIVNNLPRLKKLEQFKNCNTIQDFGKTAFENRYNNPNAKWNELFNQMENIKIDKSYYEPYRNYVKQNKEELLDMMLENYPNNKPYRRYMLNDLKAALDKNVSEMSENESMLYFNAMAAAMQKVGIK